MTGRPSALLAGVGFPVLGLAGTATMPGGPGFVAAPDEIARYYTDHSGRVLAAEAIYLLSGVLLLVFLGGLRRALDHRTAASSTVPLIASGAGYTGTALMLAAATAGAGAALRVQERDVIDPAVAAVAWDQSQLLFGLGAPMAIGVLVLATAVVGSLGRWHQILSIVLGVTLLIPPINYMAMVVFTLWVPATALAAWFSPPATNHVGATARS